MYKNSHFVATLSFFVIGVLLFGCGNEENQEPKDKNLSGFLIELQTELEFEFNDEAVLRGPLSIAIDQNNNFIWAQLRSPLYVFDATGAFVTSIGAQGQGPAEFQTAQNVRVDAGGNIYVFDSQQKRVSLFNARYEFQGGFVVEVDRTRKMTVDPEGNVYFIRDNARAGPTPAVIQFSNTGEKLGGWGEIPKAAILQEALAGGGITASSGNLFFAYMGDHRIWRVDTKSDEVIVFDDAPAYFVMPDLEKLEKMQAEALEKGSARDLVRYAFDVSRTQKLIYVNGLVLQEIAAGNPRKEGQKLYVEVWDEEGQKVASKVELPGTLVGADETYLYCLEDQIEDESENYRLYILSYNFEKD